MSRSAPASRAGGSRPPRGASASTTALRGGGRTGGTTRSRTRLGLGGAGGSTATLGRDRSGKKIDRTPAKNFTGLLQPTASRKPTNVWMLSERPGPGQYMGVPASVGRQVDGTKPTAPTVPFTTSGRQKGHGSFVQPTPSPGPKYDFVGGIGRQMDSRRKNAPSHSFGTSTRAGALNMYGIWSAKLS